MNRNVYISLDLSEDVKATIEAFNSDIKLILGDEYNKMDYANYHMTLCFLGEKFHDKKKIDGLISAYDEEDLFFHLEFDSLSLFPPDKQNLLILKFKENKNLTKFVTRLKADVKEKFNIIDKISDFMPHITIGKLKKTKQNVNDIDKKIHEMASTLIKEHDLSFDINGLHVCGLN